MDYKISDENLQDPKILDANNDKEDIPCLSGGDFIIMAKNITDCYEDIANRENELFQTLDQLCSYRFEKDIDIVDELNNINFFEIIKLILNFAFETKNQDEFGLTLAFIDILTSTTTIYSTSLYEHEIVDFFIATFENTPEDLYTTELSIIFNILHDSDIKILEDFVKSKSILQLFDLFSYCPNYLNHNMIVQTIETIFARLNLSNIGLENELKGFSANFIQSFLKIANIIVFDDDQNIENVQTTDVSLLKIFSRILLISGYDGNEDMLFRFVQFLIDMHERSEECDSYCCYCLSNLILYFETPKFFMQVYALFNFHDIFVDIASKSSEYQSNYIKLFFVFLNRLVFLKCLDESITDIFTVISSALPDLILKAKQTYINSLNAVINGSFDLCYTVLSSGLLNATMELIEIDDLNSNQKIANVFMAVYYSLEEHGIGKLLLDDEHVPDWLNLLEDVENEPGESFEIIKHILTA
ncbi:hypothetical protein TVAG_199050 [Trichomonas vaginalis G3]|uniref:Uncharacterized protein n=1 Tax=Trichomonas vaginalis (strain ATCC PRA-98 / G3) TaxID=412133 RepID=A2DDU0_TRIV3|nr:hypothetical protein TVAGG3_0999550 [Trichomonas vaginalis G3]EAY21466.1 hypothetical protein TVAG_199050 [Trichomonas vaginalis G3]KAI5490679.1 hypothetical protein TVAGG3_0999550 [Trichomonas vaginalis G3]|eukprot:XP_001582452.1 hypothetical protein [Trichomonas vaginalis G3]